jgi:hypothetical protein
MASYKITSTLSVTDALGTISLGGVTAPKTDCGVDNTFETQVVGTAAELLDVGTEITAAGLKVTCIHNMDENNFVTVYSDNGTTVIIVVPAGEARIVEPDGEYIPYVKADTASVRIKHLDAASAA